MQFYVEGAAQLADFVKPITTEIAENMIAALNASEPDGFAKGYALYAAVYWTPEGSKKRGATAVWLFRDALTDHIYVGLDDYHPRKDGKAQKIYGK